MKEENKNIEIINAFLNIIIMEKNKGEGLDKILADDFKFDDPFIKASGAAEFIEKNQAWISTEKTYKIKKQFAEGDAVCSIYTIYLRMEDGKTMDIEIADYVELRNGKMINEKLYFDPTSLKQ